ncbi:hypothetical protein [Dyella psychrodurans]|uniref:Uncharacterized protein n=1 Tax=Dyella psychrodurans TaxID=1927960 RepID=A0A370X712_9GAMM|nr:hypothetical protein [Dyella psychrodurans]RDS84146.1 hypothetical protein DWU99_10345 [Dyella psychrodurans]
MDWDWFFSSIAQSAAAIVGIFGAFIITKVLSNQAQFGERSVRIRTLKITASKLVDSANNLAFAWYIRLNREYQLEKAEDLLEENDNLDPDQLYAKLRFPSFLAREDAIQDLQAIKARRAREVEEERQRLEEELKQLAELQKTSRLFGLNNLMGLGAGTPGLIGRPKAIVPRLLSHPHEELAKERDAIDALEVEVRHHMRTISDFLMTISSNPESSVAITWALVMVAALFLVGVIYPLSFLPTPTSWTPALELHGFWTRLFSLRGVLLTIVSSIFLAALTMFAVMNRRLRYPQEEVQSLDKFTRIGTYSAYYAIAEENEKIARGKGQNV